MRKSFQIRPKTQNAGADEMIMSSDRVFAEQPLRLLRSHLPAAGRISTTTPLTAYCWYLGAAILILLARGEVSRTALSFVTEGSFCECQSHSKDYALFRRMLTSQILHQTLNLIDGIIRIVQKTIDIHMINMEALLEQILFADLVMPYARIVRPSIQFYNKVEFMTVKINNLGSNGLLTAKFLPVHLPSTQVLPEDDLGHRHLFTIGYGELFGGLPLVAGGIPFGRHADIVEDLVCPGKQIHHSIWQSKCSDRNPPRARGGVTNSFIVRDGGVALRKSISQKSQG